MFAEIVQSYTIITIIKVTKSIHALGIVHRDIKLENILVGDNFDLHIADLGFAC